MMGLMYERHIQDGADTFGQAADSSARVAQISGLLFLSTMVTDYRTALRYGYGPRSAKRYAVLRALIDLFKGAVWIAGILVALTLLLNLL